MNDIALRPQHTSGETITERLAEPTPGQYWRAKHEIKARNDQRGDYPHVVAGSVHMLKEIETANGQAHVIVLAAHPEDEDQDELRFHADDFEKHWERALDGEAVRERELADLSMQMRLTQQAMSQPPPEATTAGLLGQQPALNKGGATGQELATEEGLKDVIAHTQAVRERTATHLSWIQQHSEDLGQQASAMARYHQEKATAMMAAAKSQLSLLDALNNKVKNLKFYAGEGVEVTQLLDGTPAAQSARIVIYQDLLAFDEELLLCLDSGGIDHTMVDAVADALQDNKLLTQMIPAPRGLVLVRFRATQKEFVEVLETDDAGTATAKGMYNSTMSKESMRHRLLYRDGERVYLIECDEVLPAIKQLLPNSKEQAGYFQREYWDHRAGKRDYTEITTEELDYAKAQRKQLAVLTDYARVLIILWGLRDRTDLFATTDIRPFSNWLDEGFQRAHLELVSHDSLIGEQRPTWDQYREESNRWLSEGATVVVNTHKLAYRESAIGMFVWLDRSGYDQRWWPSQAWQIGSVQLKEGRPIMMIDVDDRNARPKHKRTALKLQRGDGYCLVLDRLLSEDLQYYLTSRASRRNYASYVAMFQQAYEFVAAREQREKPWSDWLRQSLQEGGIVCDERVIRRGILHAMASLRPKNGYPETPDEARPSLRKALLNATFDAIIDHGGRVTDVEAYVTGIDSKAVGLYRAGEADLVLYRTATRAEKDRRFSVHTFPWVIREQITIQAHRVTVQQSSIVLYRRYVGEMRLHEWEAEAKVWLNRYEPHGLGHDAIISLMAQIPVAAKALDDTRALVPALEKAYDQYNRTIKGHVGRTNALFPIGTALRNGEPVILMACIDQIEATVLWGDKGAKDRAVGWISKTYAYPENQLARLGTEASPSPCIQYLRTVAKGLIDPRGFLEGYGEAIGDADGLRKEAKQPKNARHDWEPKIRITTLTEQGARLFPWLIEFCEGAA